MSHERNELPEHSFRFHIITEKFSKNRNSFLTFPGLRIEPKTPYSADPLDKRDSQQKFSTEPKTIKKLVNYILVD